MKTEKVSALETIRTSSLFCNGHCYFVPLVKALGFGSLHTPPNLNLDLIKQIEQQIPDYRRSFLLSNFWCAWAHFDGSISKNREGIYIEWMIPNNNAFIVLFNKWVVDHCGVPEGDLKVFDRGGKNKNILSIRIYKQCGLKKVISWRRRSFSPEHGVDHKTKVMDNFSTVHFEQMSVLDKENTIYILRQKNSYIKAKNEE